jgi:pimeloyl-ACP methyl ester carboxylesterase
MYSLATHRKVDANGTRLHVVEAGAGRPLLLLHGLGWTHALWAHAFDRYAARFRVIAGDTRGHGDSDKPAGPYSIAQFASDWADALGRLDVSDAIVVGFSQGGMIAQQLALDAPRRVRALFLACTACRAAAASAANMEERIRSMREEGPEPSARIAARSIFSERYMQAHPAVVEQFVRARVTADQDALVAAMRATNGYDLLARLPSLRIPVEVLCASRDTLTPPARVAEVAEGFGVPLHTIEEAGHMVPVEQPAAFYERLDAFVSAHA